MAVPTRDASGKFSGVLIGALQMRQSTASQRASDLGFGGLVIVDRAGQQLTLVELCEAGELVAPRPDPEWRRRARRHDRARRRRRTASWPSRTRSRPGGRSRSTGRDRPSSPRHAAASLIEMISILVAAVIVLAIVGWAIARSRREIAAEQEQVRRWDELAQSLGEASAAAEVSAALGSSLATAFPRAHVSSRSRTTTAGRFTVVDVRRRRRRPARPAARRARRDRSARIPVSARRSGSRSPRPSAPSSRTLDEDARADARLDLRPADALGSRAHDRVGDAPAPARRGAPRHRQALLAAHTDYAARALGRARHSEREHDVATALQRSLLPDELPVVEGLGLAGRYNAGAVGLEVGGDWYDAVRRPDGIVHISVGDVAGRGVSAAVLMGQLRNSFRALAYEHTSPAEIARRLTQHRPRHRHGDGDLPRARPVHRRAPLLLRRPSAVAPARRRQRRGDDAGRGVGAAARLDGHEVIREARLTLRSRMTLLAYTDGLVERRGTRHRRGHRARRGRASAPARARRRGHGGRPPGDVRPTLGGVGRHRALRPPARRRPRRVPGRDPGGSARRARAAGAAEGLARAPRPHRGAGRQTPSSPSPRPATTRSSTATTATTG